MFAFEETVKKSFQKVKQDFFALKTTMHDWILFLNNKQQVQQSKIEMLERRILLLEARLANVEERKAENQTDAFVKDVLGLREI